jgi:DNA polymerase-1
MIYLISNQKEAFQNTEFKEASVSDVFIYFQDKKYVGTDTETTGLEPYTNKILMLQLGDEVNQYVIDTTTVDIQLFKEFLETKILVIHNAKFDVRFLYCVGIVPTGVFDTFLAERVLSTGIDIHGKSYSACVQRYFQKFVDKTMQTQVGKLGVTTRTVLYAAEDVIHLIPLMEAQTKLLKEHKLMSTMKLDNQFVRVLAYIEHCGIYLNSDKWTEKSEADLKDKAAELAKVNEWVLGNLPNSPFINRQMDLFSEGVTCSVNWSSPKQVTALFTHLGLNLWVIDKGKKKQSADAKVLKPQKDKSTLVPIYLHYKEVEKVCSTYGYSFLKQINSVTGRIHTQFTQIKNTGRLSSGGRDRVTKISQVNMQNIPRLPEEKFRIPGKIYERQCFEPEEGHTYVDADYSGQEQIVLANFSQEPNILAFYEKKLGDMHSYIASKLFPELEGLDLKTIKKEHKELRDIAKQAGFAINYGGNGQTIADNLSVSTSRGNEVYEAYFKAFPMLKDYFKSCQTRALRRGYVFFNSITGRKSYIDFFEEFKDLSAEVNEPGFWDLYRVEKKAQSDSYKHSLKGTVRKYFNYKGQIERKALNYPIQGTSADITKIACVYFMEWIEQNDLLFKVKICNVIHDEILVECPLGMENEVAAVLKEKMEKAGSFFCPIVPLEAEPNISLAWEH